LTARQRAAAARRQSSPSGSISSPVEHEEQRVTQDRSMPRREFLRATGGAVLLSSISALSVVGCGGSEDADPEAKTTEPRRGGRLLMSITDGSAFESFDPEELGSTFATVAGGLIYEGLTTVDKQTFEAKPLVAESWEATPQLTEWTFTLRAGVTFHNGRPVTADDVVWSLRRAFGSPEGRSTTAAFFDLEDITKADARTVRIRLEKPHAYIDRLVGRGNTPILPEGFEDFADPIGCGPFVHRRLTSTSFEAERFDGYFLEGRPYLDAVRLQLVPEQSTKLETVLSGDAHIGDGMPAKLIRLVDGSDDADTFVTRDSAFRSIVLREEKGFADPRVTRALKMLVERDKIADLVFRGNARPTPDIAIAPSDPLFPKDLPIPPYNPEQAAALLREAGKDRLSIELGTGDVQAGMNDIAVLFQESARAGGVRVDIKSVPVDSFIESFTRYPAVMSTWARGALYTYLPLLYSPGSDYDEVGYSNPRPARMLEEAISLPTLEERRQKVADACQIIQSDRGEIVPVHLDDVWPKKKALQGVESSLQAILTFRNAHLAA
jgi:peptide/nickel transport system substrate-binding protein